VTVRLAVRARLIIIRGASGGPEMSPVSQRGGRQSAAARGDLSASGSGEQAKKLRQIARRKVATFWASFSF